MSQCPHTVSDTNGTSTERPVLDILPWTSQGYRTWTVFGIHVNICPPGGLKFPLNRIIFSRTLKLQFEAIMSVACAYV